MRTAAPAWHGIALIGMAWSVSASDTHRALVRHGAALVAMEDCKEWVMISGAAWPAKVSHHQANGWCKDNCEAGFCPEDRCECGSLKTSASSDQNTQPDQNAQPSQPYKPYKPEQKADHKITRCEDFCYSGARALETDWNTRCLWSSCQNCKECDKLTEKVGSHWDEMSPAEVCQERWQNGLARDLPAREEDSHPDLRGDKCLSRPTPLLLFVHIGKTCGDTVIAALDKNNKKITSSIEAGRAAFDMVHVHPVRAEVIASMENILITLRDPIDRFISAYNNAACLAQGTERDICERVPMKNRSPNAELIRVPELGGYIMGCYPNVTVFAESLDDDTACARVARDMIGPDRADAGVSHVGRGNCYYLGGAVQWLQGKRIHIVSTDTCEEGIERIPKWLGLQGKSSRFDKAPAIHTGEFPHHYDAVSPQGRKLLYKHLKHEYYLQEEIRRIAQTSWEKLKLGGALTPKNQKGRREDGDGDGDGEQRIVHPVLKPAHSSNHRHRESVSEDAFAS